MISSTLVIPFDKHKNYILYFYIKDNYILIKAFISKIWDIYVYQSQLNPQIGKCEYFNHPKQQIK